MRTGIVRDSKYLEHDMGKYHVETPDRLKSIYHMLDHDFPHPLENIDPRPATQEEIEWIHLPEYFERVHSTKGKDRVILDPDTSTCSRSFDIALLAAGGALQAADAIMEGRVDNAFALIRPPGHHAEAAHAMGFCIFNNVAVCAEYLRRQHGLSRILIVDWDLHHGNGTQHSFWTRKDILYFSTHQFPYYPGTGHWSEIGESKGAGYTINVPLSPGKNARDYITVFKDILRPIVRKYRPDFILASAGFDIYSGDPLGGMDISHEGFAAIAAELLRISREYAHNRFLVLLEGGYHLEGQSQGVKQVLLQMNGKVPPPCIEQSPSHDLMNELAPVLEIRGKYWPTGS